MFSEPMCVGKTGGSSIAYHCQHAEGERDRKWRQARGGDSGVYMLLYQVLYLIPLRLSEPSLDGIDFNGPDIGKDVGVGGWGISL